jgi:GH24 family phage-related lysozyme (muramidase)
MSPADIACDRILSTNSEGFMADVYDDATGQLIVSQGEPTVGYGCRCRQWSKELAVAVLHFQLAEIDAALSQHSWYSDCNAARQSVLVEVAFNQGLSGLLEGYPHLIAAVEQCEWVKAGVECTVGDLALRKRYDRLAKILVTGEA